VNLSNNELSELPALWVSIWGDVDPASGLLVPPPSIMDALAVATAPKDKGSASASGSASGSGSATTKVLLIGNPLVAAAQAAARATAAASGTVAAPARTVA
jgi:predicted aconitase with swiveling domain